MIRIPLTKGYVAFIDDEDAHLAAHKWTADVTPHTVYARRVVTRPDGSTVKEYLHRAVLGGALLDAEWLDHRDGNGLDCRRANLRVATAAQNSHNRARPSNNTSGFKGVAFNRRRGKWLAYINLAGRRRYLGCDFTDPVEAAHAYDAAARDLHGDFARLNFPVAA